MPIMAMTTSSSTSVKPRRSAAAAELEGIISAFLTCAAEKLHGFRTATCIGVSDVESPP